MNTTGSKVSQITKKLSAYAKARAMPYDRVLTIFLLERAVLRILTDPELERHLVFKGGYVSVRAFESPRYTRDLDATLDGISPEVARQRILDAVTAPSRDEVTFQFSEQTNLSAQGQPGAMRISFRAWLGSAPSPIERAQLVDIDISPRDALIPTPKVTAMPLLLGEGSLSWRIYSAEAIIAEKLHAMVARGAGNSRSKDVFDVHLLLPRVNRDLLQDALAATFKARSTLLPEKIGAFLNEIDRTLVRKGWQSAAGYLKSAPDFDTTLDAIIEFFDKLDD